MPVCDLLSGLARVRKEFMGIAGDCEEGRKLERRLRDGERGWQEKLEK